MIIRWPVEGVLGHGKNTFTGETTANRARQISLFAPWQNVTIRDVRVGTITTAKISDSFGVACFEMNFTAMRRRLTLKPKFVDIKVGEKLRVRVSPGTLTFRFIGTELIAFGYR